MYTVKLLVEDEEEEEEEDKSWIGLRLRWKREGEREAWEEEEGEGEREEWEEEEGEEEGECCLVCK